MNMACRVGLLILLWGAVFSDSDSWGQQPASSPNTATNSAPSAGANAEAYVKFGRSNGANGDLDGAIAAFTEAAKIDPKYPPAYENRGVAEMLQRKLKEAIADFDTAIQLDDKYQDAYYNRGTSKAQLGDFDGAIADFNKAIELNPNYASAFYNRGHAKYFKGDLDGALADITQSINLDPSSPYAYFIRGLIRHAKGDKEGATSDFQASMNASHGFPFAAFWIWIIGTESGDRGIARSDLSDALAKSQLFKPDDWPTSIGGFLMEKVTQDELMAKAKEGNESQSRLCEAWFYTGISLRFSGDKKGALAAFQQAMATGAKDSEEYIEAQRQIDKLQAPE